MIKAAGRRALMKDWEYTQQWTREFAAGEGTVMAVDLPHNAGTLPLHYCDPQDYSFVCGYRKTIRIESLEEGKKHFLQFDGAAHQAEVYVNGQMAGSHRCGYTAFRVDITPYLAEGDNLVAVRVDTREDGTIPPFGFVVDYLTYGGIYRDVFYEVRNETRITDLFIMTPKCNQIRAEMSSEGSGFDELHICVTRVGGGAEERAERIYDEQMLERIGDDNGGTKYMFECVVPGAKLWTIGAPEVYLMEAELWKGGECVDRVSDTFGFRSMTWDDTSFYLNGEKVFVRGLNRHQSFPYIGYAAPASLQYEDARILKEELGCNAVRTSHYPQSRHFLDACDRNGLLVFTELPGWQHIGDEAWKEQAVANLRDMIVENRNHPSIFLWGVRINESVDDDDLYERTNALARVLDPTRKTSGVRYLEKSSLLEDVYAFNDFSHDGTNPGAKPKKKVMKEKDMPLLISEANGHMFPTKAFDTYERRQEHALRHARVLDAAMADGDHAGCFTWCMFDYQTHKDFGSGDRICYHGVMDVWRNPKLAASVFAAEGCGDAQLAVGSSMDIGDYPAGKIGDVYAFTNADEVRLYKNENFVTAAIPDRKQWKGLAHPPVRMSDFIGELLVTQEGYDEKKAALLRDVLRSAGDNGIANMPAADKLKMLRAMAQYGLTFEDGVALFGKYVGNWGGEATVWRFEAVKDGKAVASVTKGPGSKLCLEVKAFGKTVPGTDCGPDGAPVTAAAAEGEAYTIIPVRVRITDEYGNTASYAQLPVHFTADGGAALMSPETVTAEGGMCGCYVRIPVAENQPDAAGENAAADAFGRMTVSAPGLADVEFRIVR